MPVRTPRITTTLSLLACAGVCLLWARSHQWEDYVCWDGWDALSCRGFLRLERQTGHRCWGSHYLCHGWDRLRILRSTRLSSGGVQFGSAPGPSVWNRLGFKHQRYTFTYAVNSWQAATDFEMWLVPHWFVALLALAPAGCRCAIGAWRRARLGPGFCRT